MATTVEMPQLGETVTEGTILSWAKAVGDTISADEVLVEISTDKVDTELPSPVSGTILEIIAQEGETVAVGAAICVIGEAGEAGADAPASEDSSVQEPESAVEPDPEPAATAAPHPAEPAPGSGGDRVTIEMPQLGETVTEGTILSWAKSVGDHVAADEVLVEISTDKVDTELPSPSEGTLLEIIAQEGETVAVGAPICVIGSEAATAAPAPEPEPARPVAAPGPPPVAAAREVAATTSMSLDIEPAGEVRLVSPVVRRLAREHGIALDDVVGSGPGGRVTRKDVEAYLAGEQKAKPEPAPEPPPAEPAPEAPPSAPTPEPEALSAPERPPAPAPAPVAPAKEAPEAPVPTLPGDTVEELDRLRVRIAQNMRHSKDTAAHVFTSMEVDFERVERVRRRHKEAFKAEHGVSLTYLPFIVRATLDALREYPAVNSSFHFEERIRVLHHPLNVGIAVDLDQKGLIVPVLKNADALRLSGIAQAIKDLATRARDSKLTPDDLSGGTFAITNMGPFGSFMTAPVINVPNTAILSTDGISKRPVVVEGADGSDVIGIHHVGYLGLTWDHRAFDGSTAALFLKRIKENIEGWDWEQELA
jgi:pyruvate dehydrogenase E2 component (dihydrolipoamide acetyltransferase)